MRENGVEIEKKSLPDRLASFFYNRVKNLADSTTIKDDVYNGKKKTNATNKMFMDICSVKECIKSLKIKNCEGFDRIPQRILVDGAEVLDKVFAGLFERIYDECTVPAQWLVSKTIPIYKNKGEKNDISNYRPISNLCSSSKIFEKLILKRILEIQVEDGVDLTGTSQHGFKKRHSTCTLSLTLQSIITRALEDEDFAVMASLDLSSAFDLVNVSLLLKRLKIIGLPEDIIKLIKAWLENRSFYVSINGENSQMFDVLHGTVQGSVLGPVLYAIFVSPMFDLEDMSSFADDNYTIRWHSNLQPQTWKTRSA